MWNGLWCPCRLFKLCGVKITRSAKLGIDRFAEINMLDLLTG